MDVQVRHALVVAFGLMLAVAIGVGTAESHFGPGILAIALTLALTLAWGRWVRVETVLLAAALIGYVVGNRGFAQLMPVPGLPLFFGEGVLLIAGPITLVRCALRRELPWQRDTLDYAVLGLLTIGVVRVLGDVRSHGLLALRDFATFYYLLFFFLGQQAARASRDRRLLQGSFLAATVVLPAIVVLYQQFPEFFFGALTLAGTPLIYLKDDLSATMLLAALFPLLAPLSDRVKPARWGAAGLMLLIGVSLLSRAALAGVLVAGGLAWKGGQRRLAALALVALPAGLALTLGWATVSGQELRQTRAYGLYEHAASLFDVSGTRVYYNEASRDSGDNNRFRFVWWQTIASRVWEHNPWLGLGFGYDLARDFIRSYDGEIGDDFSVRSPHSVIFTVLGRTGWIGLAGLVFLGAILLRRTLTAARAARLQPAAANLLGWWCACWLILVSAAFGVVLEGPMGAIVFWTLLGVTQSQHRELLAAEVSVEPPTLSKKSAGPTLLSREPSLN